mgnify:CR=1 FL=1
MNENIIKSVLDHYDLINDWINQLENKADLPFYSSVDIRDAGFKVASVDTNLFPAGFNNICEVALKEAEQTFKQAVLDRVPTAQKLLLIIEEHTRNTWYLENVYVLEQLMKSTGFEVVVASFLPDSLKPQSSQNPYIRQIGARQLIGWTTTVGIATPVVMDSAQKMSMAKGLHL